MKPTQQEIIELAREAGVDRYTKSDYCAGPYWAATDAEIERLVHLALERFGAGGGEPPFLVNPSDSEMAFECVALPPRTSLYTHPSPTDLQAAYARGLEDAASIVENADTPDCGGWTTCEIAEEIRALKGKQ